VAELLNGTFVAIKVDREERPDIDAIYMGVLPDVDREWWLAFDHHNDAGPKALFLQQPISRSRADPQTGAHGTDSTGGKSMADKAG